MKSLLNTKKAFTLAETLITLAVIGIVAAMTIPTLVNKYQNVVTIAKLKKIYSTFSQLNLLSNMQGSDPGRFTSDIEQWYKQYIKPNLKTTKECFGTVGCWTARTANKDGNPVRFLTDAGIGDGIIFLTTDGYTIGMDSYASSDSDYIKDFFGVDVISQNSYILIVHIDINGEQKPNVMGEDTFVLVFDGKKFVPAGANKTDDELEEECKSIGTTCFEKIIRDGWSIN